MGPFVARAHLRGSVMLPHASIALDALLMAAIAVRDALPPPGFGPLVDIQIPISRERGIYLASTGQFSVELHEKRFINKRFPMLEAQMLGKTKMSVNPKGGLSKGFRIPAETLHLHGDLMTFYAIGDIDAVTDILSLVTHLGKKRGVGLGRVDRWVVEPIEAWPGFPVLRAGRPLRPLPLDWEGLGEHRIERRVLAPPYWQKHREEATAC
jgi:CRISPR type IV-associated protein Csf3